ncbi:methyl-accepting chemotaxis protein [Candidatus Vecturithrix granuli]|uniref:Methyl-accepting chemotaxis protein n=1 Tax=Vecturithrix granuli TaxID=1499967 RepID=A0A081C0N0_VECG1|nr:methyl-accepting chemotaxis protein [Candidatus Vecturithrix granuli]
MKIQMKLSVFIGAMLLLLAVLMVAIGTWVINAIIYRLNTDLLSLKLDTRIEKIETAAKLLEDSGATGIAAYVQQAQNEILQQLQADVETQPEVYYVLAVKDRQLLLQSKNVQQNVEQDLDFELIQEMVNQKSGSQTYSLAGANYFAVYRYFDAWDWLISASLPTTTMFRQRQTYLVTVGWTSLIVFVVLLFLAYLMGKKLIVNPVVTLVKVANQIAAGNLDQSLQMDKHDEIGVLAKAFQTMQTTIREVVVNIRDTANAIVTISQELNARSEQLSTGAAGQAASMQESSSSMQEMAANIRQNANNARETEKIAVQSAEYAEETGRVVAATVAAMQQIAEKIAIVEDIASQTRMLSLNATIEAARAQEHGKAFSVVAAEVRQLSDVTKKAAEEINQLAMSSLEVSEKAGQMLSTLVPSIQKTTELIQEISTASHEQDTGAAQVNLAIQQADQITQQNTIIAEETASSAEELANQARQLQNAIAFFTIAESSRTPANNHGIAPHPGKPEEKPLSEKRGAKEEKRASSSPKTLSLDDHVDKYDTEFERY